MDKTLMIVQIILAVLLVAAVLLQHRGTSLGGAFGGESAVYRSRRGAEKFLFYLTIAIAVIFVVMALVNVIL